MMECFFSKVSVPGSFAGTDCGSGEAAKRLFYFSGDYLIAFADGSKISGTDQIVVALFEIIRFLEQVIGSDDVHALSLFGPQAFGYRIADKVFISRANYSNQRGSNDPGLLEISNVQQLSECCAELRAYAKNVLLINYPKTCAYLIDRYAS